MVAVKLQRRGHWTGIADAIVTAFTDVEGYVADAIDKLSKQRKPSWNFRMVSTGSVTAAPWDFVVATGECVVYVPEAAIGNRAMEISVIRKTSAAVTITPVKGLINGAVTLVPASNRIRTIISSGEGWYSNA